MKILIKLHPKLEGDDSKLEHWHRFLIVRVSPLKTSKGGSRPMRSLDSGLSTNHRPPFQAHIFLWLILKAATLLQFSQSKHDGNWLSLMNSVVCHLTTTWLPLSFHLPITWRPLDYHFIILKRFHWSDVIHSTSTWHPLHIHSTCTQHPIKIHLTSFWSHLIDTGLFWTCVLEQGRVKFDSGLFQYTGPKQPRAKFCLIVLWISLTSIWIPLHYDLTSTWMRLGLVYNRSGASRVCRHLSSQDFTLTTWFPLEYHSTTNGLPLEDHLTANWLPFDYNLTST